MFEKFHPETRRAVVLAYQEATRGGRGQIECEHLLLGLLSVPGTAAEAMTAAGLGLASLRAALPGDGTAAGTADPDPLDAEALASLGIDLDAVRRATDASFGRGALDRAGAARRGRRLPTGHIPMSWNLKKSLELALRATVASRRREISSGDVLIGLLSQADNSALVALRAAGIDPVALRADVTRRMGAAA